MTTRLRAARLPLMLPLLVAILLASSTSAQTKVNPNQIGPGTLSSSITTTGSNTHTGPENFTGIVTAGNAANAVSGVFTCVSMNNVICADQQAGATADVKINAAITALTNGGTVDARGFGATTQTIAATITVGSSSAPGKSITLLLDRTTKFLCTITNSTPCLILNPGSALLAWGTVANPNAGIFLTPTSAVNNVILDQTNLGSNLVGHSVDGISIFGATGATVSDAFYGVQNALQLEHHKNLTISSNGTLNAVLVKIYATVGNTIANVEFDNISVDGLGGSGNRPVWVGCAAAGSLTGVACSQVDAISFNGPSAIVHPGSGGLPIIQVEASNGAGGVNAVGNINFYGTQIESKNTGDIGILDDGAESLHIYGLHATCNTNCGADLLRVSQPAGGSTDGVYATGIDNQGGWTNTLNNTILTKLITYASGVARLNYIYSRASTTNTNLWDDAGGNEATIDSNGIKAATINATAAFKANGTSGFSGSKVAGACTLTISEGIITNVTGC